MRTTWIMALMALAAAIALVLTACGDNVRPANADTPEDVAPVAPQPVSRTRIVSAMDAVVASGWSPDFTGCMRSLLAGARFALPLPLEEGERFAGLRFSAVGDGFTDLVATIAGVMPDGSATIAPTGSRAIADMPSTWLDYVIAFPPTLVTGHPSYWLEVTATLSGACVGAVRVTYEAAP